MFLTVQEAIDLSGKSQTTIHRLCQKHEGSKFIRKERNKYLIDKEFLTEKYPPGSENDADDDLDGVDNNPDNDIVERDIQIVELSTQIGDLQDVVKSQTTKIEELTEQLFDNQHELAEVIEANENMLIELEALQNANKSLENEAPTVIEVPSFDLQAHKQGVRYTLAGVTISSMLLIAFVFMMYYFTK